MHLPDPETTARIKQLRELGATIQSSINAYIAGIENSPSSERLGPTNTHAALSHATLAAQRQLVAAAGRLSSLVIPPQEQLVLLSAQHLEARALHIAIAADVAGIIERYGSGGCPVGVIAKESRLEKDKLGEYP